MTYSKEAIADLYVITDAALKLFYTSDDEDLDKTEKMLKGLMKTEEGNSAEIELLILQFGKKLLEQNK